MIEYISGIIDAIQGIKDDDVTISDLLMFVYCANRLYKRRVLRTDIVIQKDQYRHLYDTSELIKGLLTADYLSDEEILRNQGAYSEYMDGSKEGQKAYKKAIRRRR